MGKELEGIVCRHPLYDRNSVVILGDHVTLEQGTGCVHTAPGHGLEDFLVGRQYGLPILSPVDDQGNLQMRLVNMPVCLWVMLMPYLWNVWPKRCIGG